MPVPGGRGSDYGARVLTVRGVGALVLAVGAVVLAGCGGGDAQSVWGRSAAPPIDSADWSVTSTGGLDALTDWQLATISVGDVRCERALVFPAGDRDPASHLSPSYGLAGCRDDGTAVFDDRPEDVACMLLQGVTPGGPVARWPYSRHQLRSDTCSGFDFGRLSERTRTAGKLSDTYEPAWRLAE